MSIKVFNTDFYPRSPCGERRYRINARYTKRAEDFYPRSPCGERLMDTLILANTMLFLSTLSLRRATCAPSITPTASRNFYPRSPCGERPFVLIVGKQSRDFYPRSPCGERHYFACPFCEKCIISIHALLAESDVVQPPHTAKPIKFLSTLSLRRATWAVYMATD